MVGKNTLLIRVKKEVGHSNNISLSVKNIFIAFFSTHTHESYTNTSSSQVQFNWKHFRHLYMCQHNTILFSLMTGVLDICTVSRKGETQ